MDELLKTIFTDFIKCKFKKQIDHYEETGSEEELNELVEKIFGELYRLGFNDGVHDGYFSTSIEAELDTSYWLRSIIEHKEPDEE